jgi:regulator of sigma E protease
MQNFLISLLAFLITISLIIGIHEFGHFFAARCLGIKVLRFSIGFGKKLFSYKDNKGTEYWVSAIPFGGYVKLLDQHEGQVAKQELHLAFNRQPVYKRMLIIVAGPVLNLLFAVFVFWLTFLIGFTTIKPVIGEVITHSIAYTAGLRPQQEIVAVDNRKTIDWTAVTTSIFFRVGDTGIMRIKVKTATQQPNLYQLNLANWKVDALQPNPLRSLGIIPYVPPTLAIIGRITSSTRANTQLQVGDEILTVGNYKITDWHELVKQIKQHPDQELIFQIKRQGKIINMPIKIKHRKISLTKKIGFLGIAPHIDWPEQLTNHNKYAPWPALEHAYHRTLIFLHLNFVLIGKMIKGDFSLRGLAGPLTIFRSAGQAFYLGLIAFLNFLAFISATIGLFNLFPIPGLDGAHLCYLIIEAITGKPVSLRVQLLAFRLGILIILLIMLQAIVNDLLRLFG